ncbi:hypothetical protein M9H77_11929 [Catharanthus roseus]|uniref:Uncharacterized protein n=1 Tax=Catharanthus roseus TaxID=4058 RepID=A0ACC0BG18_CATRO|nr:hypothetical protein M9H77_11929 [Catharanthus roseus]
MQRIEAESRGRRKGKRVPSRVRAPDRFIPVKEATNFEEWTKKRRKIVLGHRVELNDIEGMEIIPNLFNNIGWIPLLIVNELFYPEMIYEFYANLYKGRVERVGNIPHQWVLSRIGGRDNAFDNRNKEGQLVGGVQDKSDDDEDDNEEQEEMNIDEKESDSEPEEETHRREIRQKKRQEREYEGHGSTHTKDLGDQSIMKKKRSSH